MRRIASGLAFPSGGVDFAYADIFPHDANLDLLHGVDFKKGCYVGQEVVSRMHHRGEPRKRIVRLTLGDGAARSRGRRSWRGRRPSARLARPPEPPRLRFCASTGSRMPRPPESR